MVGIDMDFNTSPNLTYQIPYESVVEDRPSTVSALCKFYENSLLFSEKKYTQPIDITKKTVILIDEQLLVIEKRADKEKILDTITLQNDTFKGQLNDIKSVLALSITQLAELFGVTRKTIYDWYDGTTPRKGITDRMNILIDALASTSSGTDLQRLKTVWNIPVTGKSFRALFNDEVLEPLSFSTTLEEKLHELSPRMVKKTISPHKTRVQLGEAHLAEFIKSTDFT